MIRVLIATIIVATVANGQASKLAPEQRQAILDYPLSMQRANQLIPAMEAMTKHVASLPDFKDRMAKSAAMTSAERVAQMERDPEALAILKRNHLTARDYLVGVPALRMAILAAQGMKSDAIVASPANVDFARANLAQLKPRLAAADGMVAAK
jgi:hypothetical protein